MENNSFDKFEQILNGIEKYDKSLKQIDREFVYGTSGFRCDASILHKVAFRLALGLYLKSIEFHGMPFGIMITASHNKYKDNGFKIAAFRGESAPNSWESYFTKIVNTQNLTEYFKAYIKTLAEETNRTIEEIMNTKALICYAYDTRPSSNEFDEITRNCLQLLNCDFVCYEVLTTPGLHYLTLLNQIKFAEFYKHREKTEKFHFCNKDDYWIFLKSSNNILEKHVVNSKRYLKLNSNSEAADNYEKNITFDCANGIAGYLKEDIAEIFSDDKEIKCEFINYDFADFKSLNEMTGAEHVQKEKQLPQFFHNKFLDKDNNLVEFVKNVSFDGDVDRIIYFSYKSEKNELKIIDGDYQTTLFANFIKILLENLSEKVKEAFLQRISLAIITTAYSNGGFMHYITNEVKLLKLILAKTGVKHLHHKARDYDIAIYFESNGHGTVFSNEKTFDKISEVKNSADANENDKAILNLITDLLKAFNPTVGDSLSVVVCAEKCLKMLNLKISDVYDLYENIPSVNMKKVVTDKGIYKSNEDDSRLIHPLEVQSKIDEIVSEYKTELGRCFVRASGTEDIVRIYAEAKTAEIAQKIADRVYEIVS